MVICSKAPFHIGLAGGGTDVSPFCELFGGAIVNTTISLFDHARIEVRGEQIIIKATDRNERQVFDLSENLPINGVLDLHKAVYNRLQKDYNLPVRGFHITTATDAPAGSGPGTSSTLVVSILGAFLKMYEMEMRPHAVAQYAYDIERIDLGFSGGRQDQFAASFGGFNFMSFEADNQASIVPIKLNEDYKNLLQKNLQENLDEIHTKLTAKLVEIGAPVDAIYYCTDMEDTSTNRKPNTGMALQAKEQFPEINFS